MPRKIDAGDVRETVGNVIVGILVIAVILGTFAAVIFFIWTEPLKFFAGIIIFIGLILVVTADEWIAALWNKFIADDK